MTPLVLQLQADALDANIRIADILRKSKVVAAKLDLTELKAWVDDETDGYIDNVNLPNYRRLTGHVKFANPYHGWRPVIFSDKNMERTVSQCNVYQPIGSLEDVVARSLENAGFLAYPIPGKLQTVLARILGFQTEFQLHIDSSAASGILDAVRNRVLDWSISLEQAGILGEGMAFSMREREAAKSMSGNTYNIHGNVGVLGDVAHSTVNSTQTVNYTKADLTALRGIVDQISGAASQLPGDAQKSVVAALSEARAELEAATPNHGRLRTALTSIRTTCEGAGGNLIAAGIVGLIAKFLS